ncbi:MAG: CRISPR-associated helicase Cas3' [Planctomycetales bacterium]|nr:CRISPR-associated helicase Cas3' [Planctomycetales bacterium]
MLSTHVAEVRDAAHRIWKQHSLALRNSAELLDWIDSAVSMHDVGKGTQAFQAYIRNVRGFKGDRRRKAHTPFSFIAALGYGKNAGWSWRQMLAVGVAALGHHSGFKMHEELERYLRSYEWQDILVDQLDDFDWKSVSDAVLPNASTLRLNPAFSTDSDLDILAGWLADSLVEESLHQLSIPEAIYYRLQCQFVHSVLLEADKAFLIMSDEERPKYRAAMNRPIPALIVSRFIDQSSAESALNPVRNKMRSQLETSLESNELSRVQTMTLPTGSGKTLLAATWALSHRERFRTNDHSPPMIIVLPFLSIIEQTQSIYRKLLADEGVLLSYHSLSVRDHQDSEDPDTAEFFLDTWHGDVIVTTFDQFLFALLDPRGRSQMRFHQLADALIVMDEVQALPCILWDLVSNALAQLIELGNGRVLAMSATQTGFLPDAVELINEPAAIFESLDRYEIVLRHGERISLDQFVDEVVSRAKNWNDERVLIVLNTRNSARTVRDELAERGPSVHFISADVTPKDRLATIELIKAGKPCIVVSTQCIEAGVDIDMSLVIRDFAPLDSVIQVAGRCNRHADRARETVELVRLENETGKQFCTMIYDKILLQETTAILNERQTQSNESRILEKEVFRLSQKYFERLRQNKDLGARYTESFARWEEIPPIRELLRLQSKQESFVVIEQDPSLREELVRVSLISDRWERRRELRKLAARIAAITVSVYVQAGFDPEQFSDRDPTDNFWLLRPGYYRSDRGIDLANGYSDHENASSTTVF